MTKNPIMIDGKKVGKLKASWLLFKEAFRFFKADKEMIFIPLIMALANLFIFGVIVAIFVMVVLGGDVHLSGDGEPTSMIEYIFMFCVYVAGAFTIALSQAAIVNTVYTRAHGEDASLMDSIKAAWSRAGALFVWSVITSTVGLFLRAIAERSRLLGVIVVLFVGAAWSVLTYFVVPAMVIDKKSAFGSISRSGKVFQETWGETIVSNFGLGLVFFIVHLLGVLSFFGLAIAVISVGATPLFIVLVLIYAAFVFAAILLQSALDSVLKTLLYMYASEGYIPFNFNQELIEGMIARKNAHTAVAKAATSNNI